ncbi:MAG TPA: hypothetical protein VFH30_06300 [Acidimicrobiales bacterium]|nr:hypothetical protein [Acidimicrobiales bacterium]
MLGALVRRYGHFDACEDAVRNGAVQGQSSGPRHVGVPAWLTRWAGTAMSRVRRVRATVSSSPSRDAAELGGLAVDVVGEYAP